MNESHEQKSGMPIDLHAAGMIELAMRVGQAEEEAEGLKKREALLMDAIQSERREREIERMMWKNIVELEKRQVELAESDLVACQQVLKMAAHVSDTQLRFLMNWVWTRSTPQEIIDHRGTRDAIHQMIGMLQAFAPREGEGE